jgi:hypothetical protein
MRHSSTSRNLFQRLKDAESISKQLEGVWSEFQMAYNKLIVSSSSLYWELADCVCRRRRYWRSRASCFSMG